MGLAGHGEKSRFYSGCSGNRSDEVRFTSFQSILWSQSERCVGRGWGRRGGSSALQGESGFREVKTWRWGSAVAGPEVTRRAGKLQGRWALLQVPRTPQPGCSHAPSPFLTHSVIVPPHPPLSWARKSWHHRDVTDPARASEPPTWCVRQSRGVPQLLDFKAGFPEEVTSQLPHPPLVSSDTV